MVGDGISQCLVYISEDRTTHAALIYSKLRHRDSEELCSGLAMASFSGNLEEVEIVSTTNLPKEIETNPLIARNFIKENDVGAFYKAHLEYRNQMQKSYLSIESQDHAFALFEEAEKLDTEYLLSRNVIRPLSLEEIDEIED